MSQAIASSAPLHKTSDTDRACTLLCTYFANALDAQAYSSVRQLFTDDAEIVSEGRAVRGHDAIRNRSAHDRPR
ncbi:hypothetical protein C5O80_31755 [Burkholderia sp. SRS-46]|nr:hypothetical protein C5O80_31755 [Burkholderia sp. SRS-46]